ncbi:hypothetical protein [Bacillus sp. JJ1562]|uniref:hypothetical protein n=1 Tax=Bacillus sp. JJ1562 TaxID=3122960 RepID=UPI0030017A8A
MNILLKRKPRERIEPEVVTARYKITCNIHKTDQSVLEQGIKIDSKHLILKTDDGIVAMTYKNKGTYIETGEDCKLKGLIHLFIKDNPIDALDLNELSRMSFVDFIHKLIDIGIER